MKSWEGKTRTFLVLMGSNPNRGGKHRWNQKSIKMEIERGSEPDGSPRSISSSAVYGYLQELESAGLVRSEEVEPERGIRKKRVYYVNFDSHKEKLSSEERRILESFFERFGDDFMKRASGGLEYGLVQGLINDPLLLAITIRQVVRAPLDAAWVRKGEAADIYEKYISTGSLDYLSPFLDVLKVAPLEVCGIEEYRREVNRYREDLSEEDVEFLGRNSGLIVSLLSGWEDKLAEISDIT